MRILGLSSFRHSTTAALLVDGKCVAAIENAKLTRAYTPGLPEAAIRFCLEQGGIKWSDLDAVAIASQPLQGWARRFLGAVKASARSPLSGAHYQVKEFGRLAGDMSDLRTLKCGEPSQCRLFTFEHHLCHAAAAFYPSPYDRALILTLDEDGDGRTGLIAVGEGTRIRALKMIPVPHSLSWVYSRITELIGFAPKREEHKTQWLGLQGEPAIKTLFVDMFRRGNDSIPYLHPDSVRHSNTGRLELSRSFLKRAGVSGQERLGQDQRCALASSIQASCTELVSDLVAHYLRQEGLQYVCLAGGLFENTLLVSDLERRIGMGRIFVPPAPGNPGTALGAGMLAWHQQNNVRCEGGPENYCGPEFKANEIGDLLVNSKSHFLFHQTFDQRLSRTVRLLQAGKIVGWFQGRAEFGLRALGNRSLLASPWAPYVKENLNDFIKHREWFRPFAVAVPEEDSARYFQASPLSPWMHSLADVRDNVDPVLKEFCLPGNRIRLHVVERKRNPLFWSLLKNFGSSAPAPILLNTSFNMVGEPLVTRPQDAIRSYFGSGIDALAMDNFLLMKHTTKHVLADAATQREAGSNGIAAHKSSLTRAV